MISSGKYIIRNTERFLPNSLGSELVMLDTKSGNFIGINAIGSVIWSILETPVTTHALIQQLISKYNVAPDLCKAETEAYLQQMLDTGLISFQD